MLARLADLVTGWQTILIKIGIVLIALLLTFLVGYVQGYKHEKRKLDIFSAQVKVLGDDAARKAKEAKAQHDAVTAKIKEDYENEIDLLHAYHAANPRIVLRNYPGGGGTASAPKRSECPDVSGPKSVASGAGGEGSTGACDTRIDQQILWACVEDAAHVRALQDFLRSNNFPVEP